MEEEKEGNRMRSTKRETKRGIVRGNGSSSKRTNKTRTVSGIALPSLSNIYTLVQIMILIVVMV